MPARDHRHSPRTSPTFNCKNLLSGLSTVVLALWTILHPATRVSFLKYSYKNDWVTSAPKVLQWLILLQLLSMDPHGLHVPAPPTSSFLLTSVPLDACSPVHSVLSTLPSSSHRRIFAHAVPPPETGASRALFQRTPRDSREYHSPRWHHRCVGLNYLKGEVGFPDDQRVTVSAGLRAVWNALALITWGSLKCPFGGRSLPWPSKRGQVSPSVIITKLCLHGTSRNYR